MMMCCRMEPHHSWRSWQAAEQTAVVVVVMVVEEVTGVGGSAQKPREQGRGRETYLRSVESFPSSPGYL